MEKLVDPPVRISLAIYDFTIHIINIYECVTDGKGKC